MNAEMLAAVNAATSSDVLTFCIEDFEITLYPSLDRESGGLRWLQDTTENAAIRRHLATKRWLIPMLLDTPRNTLYAKAISQAVAKFRGDSTTSLDIGTGTGLLAMLTAKADNNFRVMSLEMSSPMANLASSIVSSNDLSDRVEIKPIHSATVQPDSMPSVPSLCTSELLDYQLIGEGIIPTLRDLFQRSVITKDTVVVPSNGQIYARLLSFEGVRRYGSFPEDGMYENVSFGEYGESCCHRVIPFQGLKVGERLEFVSDKFAPFADGFVFDDADMIPRPEGRVCKVNVEIERGGGDDDEVVVGGVFFYWDLELLRNSGLKYSTEYGAQQFQDHWPGSLFVLSELSRVKVKRGGAVEVTCEHDDSNVWFTVCKRKGNKRPKFGDDAGNVIAARVPPALPAFSAARLNMLNSPDRAKFFNGALGLALEGARILDVSDFCLLGLILNSTAEGGTNNSVTSLESCDPKVAMHSATVAQLHNGVDVDKFAIVNCAASDLRVDHLVGGEKVSLIVSECWYEKMEDNMVLCALNFHYTCAGLLKQGISTEGCAVFPSVFRIMAVAIRFRDGMQDAYKRVKEVEGFDHSDLDAVGADCYKNYDLGIDLFNQYNFEVVSEAKDCCCVEVGIEETESVSLGGEGVLKIKNAGVVDAVVCFVEFEAFKGGDIFSTFEKHFSSQRVRFIRDEDKKSEKVYEVGDELTVAFRADSGSGEPYNVYIT
ncbi:hypothetical protein TrVE_jg2165 [Triparma verrucosa]|uniref:Arginine N-methyltransferase n=1 Tax=Triparma verrucosa TaxID=1606542 RepID=A0A9W7B9U1_9STRA|nr:hypothetical protein TrVE_jg2165 [Triparma verrucosa]